MIAILESKIYLGQRLTIIHHLRVCRLKCYFVLTYPFLNTILVVGFKQQ